MRFPRSIILKVIMFVLAFLILYTLFFAIGAAVVRYQLRQESLDAQLWLLTGAGVGWSEDQVRASLGEPFQVVRDRATLERISRSWVPVPEFRANEKVLVYSKAWFRAYVYVDSRGIVTKVLYAKT